MTTLIQPSRRSFISGLTALVVAPAIIRASNLMPVKNFYYDRFLVDYEIGLDCLVIRMDRAQFPLYEPKYGFKPGLTLSAVTKRVPTHVIDAFNKLKPDMGQQHCVTYVLPYKSREHGWLL